VLQILLIELVRSAGHPETWVQLVARGIITTAGSAILVLTVGVTSAERRRVFLHLPGLRRQVAPEVEGRVQV
jgi:hypothetical protein